MDYTILDISYADKILPSFYKVSVIQMSGLFIKERREFFFDPECDFDESLVIKYNINPNEFNNGVYLKDKWASISKMIEGRDVFIFGATEKVDSLIYKASVDYLRVPAFKYICIRSAITKCLKTPNRPSLEELNVLLDIEEDSRENILIEIMRLIMSTTNPVVIHEFLEEYKVSYGYSINNKRVIANKNTKGLEDMYERGFTRFD